LEPTASARRTVRTFPEGMVTVVGTRRSELCELAALEPCGLASFCWAAELSVPWAELSLLVELGLLHPMPSANNEANANTKARIVIVISPAGAIMRN
jgi:hypothetical protein